MSKNEPNTVTTPGASASRSRSTQKVLDIQRRLIDAPRRVTCFFVFFYRRGRGGLAQIKFTQALSLRSRRKHKARVASPRIRSARAPGFMLTLASQAKSLFVQSLQSRSRQLT